jgi:outer membrane immunogenic protein
MKRIVVCVAAALVVTAGQAAAEGLPPTSRIRAPGTVVGPNWNGFYIGAGIGAGVVSHDLSGTETKNREVCKEWKKVKYGKYHCFVCTKYGYEQDTKSFSDSGTSDVGIFGVVAVGYDRVLREGWVGGVFADYDFGSGISGDVSVGGVNTSLDHNHSWAVGVRLGHLITPSTLLYGAAGYTQAEFELNGFGARTFGGYFVGAGVETFLHANWTLKLEYRFSQFGEETVVDQANLSADLEPSMHSARLVLTYKVGRHD